MNISKLIWSVVIYVAAWFALQVMFFYFLPRFAITREQRESVLGATLPVMMCAFFLGLAILLSTRLYLLRKERLAQTVGKQ